MRIYDPRVGRLLSVDPLGKSFPWYTPYQYAGDKPTAKIDFNGSQDEDPDEEIADKEAALDESDKIARQLRLSEALSQFKPPYRVPPSETLTKNGLPRLSLDMLGAPKPRINNNYLENAFGALEQWEASNNASAKELKKSIASVELPPLKTEPERFPELKVDIRESYKPYNDLVKGVISANPNLNIIEADTYIQGANDKFIVIGRSQETRINPFAERLKEAGLNVKTINEWYPNGPATPEMNDKWIKDRISEGYSIIDIGLDPNYRRTNDFQKDAGEYYSREIKAVKTATFLTTVNASKAVKTLSTNGTTQGNRTSVH